MLAAQAGRIISSTCRQISVGFMSWESKDFVNLMCKIQYHKHQDNRYLIEHEQWCSQYLLHQRGLFLGTIFALCNTWDSMNNCIFQYIVDYINILSYYYRGEIYMQESLVWLQHSSLSVIIITYKVYYLSLPLCIDLHEFATR